MNPDIARLEELAGLDEKLRFLDGCRREREDAVRAAETGLAGAESHVADRHGEITRLRKEAEAINLDVRAVEDEVRKLDDKLSGAKSNKEHAILAREIGQLKEKKSGLEDGVLERLVQVDAVTEEEKAGKARVDEAGTALSEARKDLESAQAEIGKEVSDLGARREGILAELEPEVRDLYEKILSQRGDAALAKASGGACSGCSRKLTPQMQNLVDVGEEIVQCMSCNRILCADEG